MIERGIILGTDIFSGEVVRRNLPELTHFLVSGVSGAGKSVWLHQLAYQLARHPGCERLHLVDFKLGVEFCIYEGLSDRVRVIWEFADFIGLVGDLHELMRRRLMEMRERRWRNWKGPRVFVVIDEYAEIHLCPAEKSVQSRLINDLSSLVARSRGAGIVIVAATQKPTSEFIGAAVAGNLQSRVCFRASNNLVASMVLGSLDDLRREPGLDPVSLRLGWCIFRDGMTGEARYLQPHIAPGVEA